MQALVYVYIYIIYMLCLGFTLYPFRHRHNNDNNADSASSILMRMRSTVFVWLLALCCLQYGGHPFAKHCDNHSEKKHTLRTQITNKQTLRLLRINTLYSDRGRFDHQSPANGNGDRTGCCCAPLLNQHNEAHVAHDATMRYAFDMLVGLRVVCCVIVVNTDQRKGKATRLAHSTLPESAVCACGCCSVRTATTFGLQVYLLWGGCLLFILVYCLCVWAVVVGLLHVLRIGFLVGIGKGDGGGGGEHTQKKRGKKNTNTNHEPNERGEITALALPRCWKYAGELFQGSANSIHILTNTHT